MSFILQSKQVPEEERLPVIAIMIPVLDIFNRFIRKTQRKMNSVEKLDFSSMCSSQDRMFIVVGPFVGAPAGTMLLERLLMRGVTKVILLGFCGALLENMNFGDVVIPETGLSEEGVSRLYGFEKNIPAPSNGIVTSLKRVAEEFDTPVFSGGIWSTDAPFMETSQKVAHFREKGAVAVDMESTALLSVGRFRGIEVASLLIVTDNISSGIWKTGFYSKGFKRGVKRGMEVALETVNRLKHN